MAVKNLVTLFSGTAAAQVIVFAALPVVTRLFSPDEFGKYGIFLAFLGIATPVACLTLEHAIVPEQDKSNRLETYLAGKKLSKLVAVVFCLVYAVYQLAHSTTGNLADILALILLFFAITTTANFNLAKQLLLKEGRFYEIATSLWKGSVAKIITQILPAIFFPIFPVLAAAELLSRLVQTRLLKRAHNLQSSKSMNWQEVKEYISQKSSYIKFGTPSTLINSFSLFAFIPIFALIFGATKIGYLVLAQRILQTPMGIISRTVSDYFYREINEKIEKSQTITPYFYKALFILFLIGLAFISSVLVVLKFLFTDIFGESWREASELIIIISPWVLAGFSVSPLSRIVFALNAQKQKLMYDICTLSSILITTIMALQLNLNFKDAVLTLSLLFTLSYFIYLFLLRRTCRKHDISIS